MAYTLSLRARHLLAVSRAVTLLQRYGELSRQAEQLNHAARNLRHRIGLLRAVRQIQRKR